MSSEKISDLRIEELPEDYPLSIYHALKLEAKYPSTFFSPPYRNRVEVLKSIIKNIENIESSAEMLNFFAELDRVRFMSATSFLGEKFPKYRINYIDDDKTRPHAIVEDAKEKTNKTMYLIGKLCQIKKNILSYKVPGRIISVKEVDEEILRGVEKELQDHLKREYNITEGMRNNSSTNLSSRGSFQSRVSTPSFPSSPSESDQEEGVRSDRSS